MRIKEIAISHYGPLRDVRHRFEPGLRVFFGPNESGKTLLLEATLKLLLGKNLKDFQGIERVPGLPQGRVTLIHRSKEYIFDGKLLLESVTGLSNRDMRNIFIIRNKDLQFKDQANYLGQLNDQLLGMEGQRLAKLKGAFRILGRLTRASSDAPLSKSQDFQGIGESVITARELAEEIKKYLAEAKDKQLDFVERELESLKRRLKEINESLKLLEVAADWARYDDLRQKVENYTIEENKAKALNDYQQSKFLELKDLESRSVANKDSATEGEKKLGQLLPLIVEAETQFQEASLDYSSMEGKKLILEQLSQQAETTAENSSPPVKILFGRFGFALLGIAAISLLLTAKDLLPPSLLNLPYWAIGGALIFLALDSSLRWRKYKDKKKHIYLLQKGAAVGLLVTSIQELAAAASAEKLAIDKARNRQQQKGEDLRRLTDQKRFLEEDIANATGLATKLAQDLKNHLAHLAIDNLTQFEVKMEEYRQARRRCDDLSRALASAFDHTLESGDDWHRLFQQIQAPPNPNHPYDENLAVQLRYEKDMIGQNIDELQEKLIVHQTELARFAAACQGLPIENETGLKLSPHFPDLVMLDYSHTVLNQFINTVTETHATACSLIAIIEKLEAEERAKMTDLVGPNKPLQRHFSSITEGSYRQVKLDENLDIMVVNRDGLELAASTLSQGTYDQLYLALRLSLAEDLIGDQAGFFLLDDAYLCADSSRLERMFELLIELVEKGWQIVYFTMDDRIFNYEPWAKLTTILPPLT